MVNEKIYAMFFSNIMENICIGGNLFDAYTVGFMLSYFMFCVFNTWTWRGVVTLYY